MNQRSSMSVTIWQKSADHSLKIEFKSDGVQKYQLARTNSQNIIFALSLVITSAPFGT